MIGCQTEFDAGTACGGIFRPITDAKNSHNIQFDRRRSPISTLIPVNSLTQGPFAMWAPRVCRSPSVSKKDLLPYGRRYCHNRPDDFLRKCRFNPPNYARFGLCCGLWGQPGGDAVHPLPVTISCHRRKMPLTAILRIRRLPSESTHLRAVPRTPCNPTNPGNLRRIT
jgi:hypothetical protein